MKVLTNTKHLFALALITAVTFSACSSVNNEVESLSEEDLELAAEIVGTSLSDNESGVVSSMYDAFSSMDDQGLPYDGTRMKQNNHRHREESGRGRESNFSHEYDPVTGIHTISFDRIVQTPRFTKSVSVDQEIIFTGIDGNFLARPRADRDSIESIAFTGIKSGTATGPFRSSSFTKIDTMRIAGVHATSGTLTMNGNHHGFGEAEGTLPDSSTASRDYDIRITFENVAINKDTVKAYGNLEQGVSGTLTYSIVMNKTINGDPEETIVEGTIDLEEDGTALLRFNKASKVIRLSLIDGEPEDRPRR
jgi:hypothetical protein